MGWGKKTFGPEKLNDSLKHIGQKWQSLNLKSLQYLLFPHQPLLWQPLLLPIKLLKSVFLKTWIFFRITQRPSLISLHQTQGSVFLLLFWVTLLHTNFWELFSWTPRWHSIYSMIVMYVTRALLPPREIIKEFLSNEELQFYLGNQHVHESFSE